MSVYFAAGALVVHGYRTTFIKPDCLLEVATNDEGVGHRGDAGGVTGKSSGCQRTCPECPRWLNRRSNNGGLDWQLLTRGGSGQISSYCMQWGTPRRDLPLV
jgi:hypothetical protein